MEFVELFAGDRARQFDATIRARIPAYDAVLQLAVAELACRCSAGAVLSVGCGSGQDVVDLARRSDYRVTAIDPSPDMVALAARRFQAEGIGGVDLRCCTVSDLTDEPRFDGALLCFVLHFIPDDGSKDRLLEQIARRLKPGAELVVLDFCRTDDATRDLSALRVYLDWFSRMGAADRDAYLTRLQRELHLLPADAYPDRARRAGFTGARPFLASLHVGGWILERA